jgi:hypothetical protein
MPISSIHVFHRHWISVMVTTHLDAIRIVASTLRSRSHFRSPVLYIYRYSFPSFFLFYYIYIILWSFWRWLRSAIDWCWGEAAVYSKTQKGNKETQNSGSKTKSRKERHCGAASQQPIPAGPCHCRRRRQPSPQNRLPPVVWMIDMEKAWQNRKRASTSYFQNQQEDDVMPRRSVIGHHS